MSLVLPDFDTFLLQNFLEQPGPVELDAMAEFCAHADRRGGH